jgi:dephospho-CoA kinase
MPNHDQQRRDRRLVIGVAGRSGSGKSLVARHLERECGFQYLRYSFVLADWFGIEPEDKARLQKIGWEVMSGGKQPELNRRLIAQVAPDRDCVVDGLRHPLDPESLRNEFSSRFFLIYVNTPAELRFERLRARYATLEDFVIADSHPVESNIDSLKLLASAVLPGTLSQNQLTIGAGDLVRAFRSG